MRVECNHYEKASPRGVHRDFDSKNFCARSGHFSKQRADDDYQPLSPRAIPRRAGAERHSSRIVYRKRWRSGRQPDSHWQRDELFSAGTFQRRHAHSHRLDRNRATPGPSVVGIYSLFQFETALAAAFGGDGSVELGVSAPINFVTTQSPAPPGSIANAGLTPITLGWPCTVPEPSGIALLLFGAAVSFLFRRKRERS
jgi:hypothetical protein